MQFSSIITLGDFAAAASAVAAAAQVGILWLRLRARRGRRTLKFDFGTYCQGGKLNAGTKPKARRENHHHG